MKKALGDMGAGRIFSGEGKWWAETRRAEAGWGSWGGAASHSPPAKGLWERCNLPSGVQGGAPVQIDFCTFFWPLDDHWRLRFWPLIAWLYVKIRGQLALASRSQIWGTRRASHRFPSKYEYDNKQVYRNEQSFTVFLHGKPAPRPFKLTSEMSFSRGKTFQLFQGRASAPACPCLWAPMLGETQTLRTGRSNAEPNNFAPPQTPFPGAQDSQNLISCRWSLPAPTDPVWWRSMHAISIYRGNRHSPPARPPACPLQTPTDRTDNNTLRR